MRTPLERQWSLANKTVGFLELRYDMTELL